jgi:hypothetical protein
MAKPPIPRTASGLAALALALGAVTLAACGTEEASAMTKFADQMCACKDVPCADKLFPEIEKMAKENEGKEVVAAAADKYNAEMDRAQKCYEKVFADAEKAEGEAAPK